MPVALRAHLALSDRLRPPPPDGSRVVLGSEDDDLLRLEAASQRLVGGEPCETGADDGHTGHYFTEPASRP